MSCLNSHTPFEVSHRTCKQVFLVSVLSLLTGLSYLIFFWCSPPSSASAGGRLRQGGKEKFVTSELSFQASDKPRKKKTGSESPESLASRISRTLDGVPRSGKWEGGTSKCDHSATFVYRFVYSSSARLSTGSTGTKLYRCKVDNWLETCDREELRKIC